MVKINGNPFLIEISRNKMFVSTWKYTGMDLLRFLCYIALGLGMQSIIQCQIDYDRSDFLLKTPEARSHVMHGENLTYTFSIVCNLTTPADSMSVVINGSNLQFIDTTDLMETKFNWQTADGRTTETKAPFSVEVLKESNLHPVSELDLQMPLSIGELQLQNISGQLELHVTDTAPLGSLIRPVMYISLFLEENSVYQTNILGDYVYLETPDMILSSVEPRDLEMKQTATLMTYLRIPTLPMKQSLLNVYMPRNETTSFEIDDLHADEPYLTVTDFQFVGDTGISMESYQRISDTFPVYLSTSRTSEIDQVVFAIPELNDAVYMNTSCELDFLMEVQSLDFTGSHDGFEQTVVSVLETGSHLFVIRKITLNTKRTSDVDYVPKLNLALDLMETETANAESTVQYQLKVCHAENVSWSSAYNVSILLFLPPFLHGAEILRTKDVVRTNTPVANILHENLVEFKVKRISFIHNVRLQFSLKLNTAHEIYARGKEYMIIAETWYSNWRDQTTSKDTVGFQNAFNITATNEKTKVNPTCECLRDKFAQCRCSGENRCGQKNNGVSCVDCNMPWRCVNTIEGYGRACTLKGGGNFSYICGTTKRNRKAWELNACVKQYTNGTIERLPPAVGTILARDTDRNYLYGISQNGLSYMLSKTEGITWYNIPPLMYSHASLMTTFEPAEFNLE